MLLQSIIKHCNLQTQRLLFSKFGPSLFVIEMTSAEMHRVCLLIEELLNEVSDANAMSGNWKGKRGVGKDV